jgi:hypothetical protein
VFVGLRLDHKAPAGNKCVTTVSFVNAKKEPETTPEWTVESREPLTISPTIECKGEYYELKCNFKGSVVDGAWVPGEES